MSYHSSRRHLPRRTAFSQGVTLLKTDRLSSAWKLAASPVKYDYLSVFSTLSLQYSVLRYGVRTRNHIYPSIVLATMALLLRLALKKLCQSMISSGITLFQDSRCNNKETLLLDDTLELSPKDTPHPWVSGYHAKQKQSR